MSEKSEEKAGLGTRELDWVLVRVSLAAVPGDNSFMFGWTGVTFVFVVRNILEGVSQVDWMLHKGGLTLEACTRHLI